ncbi:putative ACR [Candidatus Hepatincola sp. Av]
MSQKTSCFKIGDSLKGKLLVAPPTMLDNRFFNSLILITSHDSNGAVGLVINKKSAHQFHHIVSNIDKNFNLEEINTSGKQVNIVLGGPMHSNSIFILHSNDYHEDTSLPINEYLSMTNKPDLIIKLAQNHGPYHSLISIGCSTWSPQQLEKELQSYGWLITDYNEDFIHHDADNLYNLAMDSLGINNSNYALFLHNTQK